MPDSRPIGVFDSGLGGLTVLKELINILPHENFVYFGDTGRVPYGNKSNETIINYAKQDEEFLLSKNVKYIIAACGTVSSVTANTSNNLPVPFMGVIENSVKDAVEVTVNKKIGVIGTAATITNGVHKKLILNYLPDAEVTEVKCPLFVPLVEEGITDENDIVVIETVKRYLKPIVENGVDTLILGCTHYPVLKKAIKKVLGEDVRLINMGFATAKAVMKELEVLGLLNDASNKQNIEYYVSDMTSSFGPMARNLLGYTVENVGLVNISKYEGSFD